ncbi:hypothetical protein DSO57_1028516 [Entomophthora muscae]|uniref:Uncharacterized protein n=1 Tax=Entomophthora muscae TaxID=34485 RepID=A0ACC2SE38_9FUNG|nr:hypothetical protein DSO57_1028516 [Entomophthora muscae]
MVSSTNSTSERHVLVTEEGKNCVSCKPRQLSCPSCEDGFMCHLTVRTCTTCPMMTCKGPQSPKPDDNIVPLAIGVTVATVAIVVFILGMIVRRKYKQDKGVYGSRITSMGPLSMSRASDLTEKHTTVESNSNPLIQIRPFRRQPSATFSDLNFKCDELPENDCEKPISRPKQAVSSDHFKSSNNRPPENLNGFISPDTSKKLRPPSENWMRMSFPAMGEGLDMRQIDAQASHERAFQGSSYILGPDLGLDADFHLSIQFPSSQK